MDCTLLRRDTAASQAELSSCTTGYCSSGSGRTALFCHDMPKAWDPCRAHHVRWQGAALPECLMYCSCSYFTGELRQSELCRQGRSGMTTKDNAFDDLQPIDLPMEIHAPDSACQTHNVQAKLSSPDSPQAVMGVCSS